MLRQILKLIFLIVVFTPIVNADPITLSGSVTLVTGPLPSGVRVEPFVLTGIGFSTSVISSNAGFGISPCSIVSLGPPSPCTTANLGWNAVGTDNFGSITLNGQTVAIDVINQLGLDFESVTFVIPEELRSAPGVVVTAPFTFTGVAVVNGSSADLTGQGTVRLLLLQKAVEGVSGLFLERADYTFGPTPSGVSVEAIPEPATLLLLASGVAAAGLLKKRRQLRLK